VADKLGVDPSYVSRVSRGERRSPKIEVLLRREVSKLLKSANRRAEVKKT
jgi:predicted transcriptional regulator